jgi:hypothetical protein
METKAYLGWIDFYMELADKLKQEINRYINKTTQPNIGLQSINFYSLCLPLRSKNESLPNWKKSCRCVNG